MTCIATSHLMYFSFSLVVVTCLASNLPAPLHGGKSGCPHDRELFGSVCSLFCDVGYEASEATPVRRVCQDDGQGGGVWSGGPISCSG